jgi:hypothetical protein
MTKNENNTTEDCENQTIPAYYGNYISTAREDEPPFDDLDSVAASFCFFLDNFVDMEDFANDLEDANKDENENSMNPNIEKVYIEECLSDSSMWEISNYRPKEEEIRERWPDKFDKAGEELFSGIFIHKLLGAVCIVACFSDREFGFTVHESASDLGMKFTPGKLPPKKNCSWVR